jgi:LysR family transcriptional regulator, transcriptional activator of the cysJI operon
MVMGMDAADPGDLAVLVRMVDAGSVTRAAQLLYISQPAVTHRLRRLERVLGARLVERRGRGLALTEAGRAVLPLARQALQILEQMPLAVSEVQGLLRGEVILGASTTVGEFVLPKRLSAFAQAYPHLTVRLYIANTQAVVERVLNRSLNAGVVGSRPAHVALALVPFLSDEIVLVAGPSHDLAGTRVAADQLSRTRLLLREEGSATRAMALQALARCGVETEATVGFGSNAAVRTAVLAGYGIAALSREVVADDLADGRLRVVRVAGWKCQRRFYIIRRRDRKLSKAEDLLLEFLRPQGLPGNRSHAGTAARKLSP